MEIDVIQTHQNAKKENKINIIIPTAQHRSNSNSEKITRRT